MPRMDVIKQLEDLADWFENPRRSPWLLVKVGNTEYMAGFLLRTIALNLEAEGWINGTLCDMREAGTPGEPGQHGDTVPRVGGVGDFASVPKGTVPSGESSSGER